MQVKSRKKAEPVKLQATVSSVVGGVLDAMAFNGVFGHSRAEVASFLLTNWVLTHEQFVAKFGISLAGSAQWEAGDGAQED